MGKDEKKRTSEWTKIEEKSIATLVPFLVHRVVLLLLTM